MVSLNAEIIKVVFVQVDVVGLKVPTERRGLDGTT